MENNIKDSLFSELETLKKHILVINKFQEENPATVESLAKMSNVVKAKLGSLNFKKEHYVVEFQTICNILKKYCAVNLENTLSAELRKIYETPKTGDMVEVRNGSVEFVSNIPELNEFLNKMN